MHQLRTSPRSVDDVLPGEMFGRLAVIGPSVAGDIGSYLPCMCECGKPFFALWSRLSSGGTKSCGCYKGRKTHGSRRTRLYNIWSNMRTRCFNSNTSSFPNYGGRGITVCEPWTRDFVEFKTWAEASGYTDLLTLERNDVNGNYCPENCSWIPLSEQSRNRRSAVLIHHLGETKNLKDWSDDPRCLVKYHTLYHRVKSGWAMQVAMTTLPNG